MVEHNSFHTKPTGGKTLLHAREKPHIYSADSTYSMAADWGGVGLWEIVFVCLLLSWDGRLASCSGNFGGWVGWAI